MSNDDVYVIVPVYNEATTIATTVSDLLESFRHVVCIDDGSRDDSAELARRAGATVLRHAINQGQGAALRTGFDFVVRQTDAAYAVTFDADGQHRVEDAVRMVRRARTENLDVVLATRFAGSAHQVPRLRRAVLLAALTLTRFTSHLEVTDTHNGLRVLSRNALQKIDLRMRYMSIRQPSTAFHPEYQKDRSTRYSCA